MFSFSSASLLVHPFIKFRVDLQNFLFQKWKTVGKKISLEEGLALLLLFFLLTLILNSLKENFR